MSLRTEKDADRIIGFAAGSMAGYAAGTMADSCNDEFVDVVGEGVDDVYPW